MRKTHLSAAIALCLGCTALGAAEITVTTMEFYDAGGNYNPNNGGFNDDVQGSVNSDANGSFNSGSIDFFYAPWTADQVIWFDTPGAHTWAGTTVQGAFSYTFTLIENQVAAGTYFDWSGNDDIPVLAVFDCGPNLGDACTAVDADNDGAPGVAMVTSPFPGQTAAFSGVAATVIDAKPVAVDDTTSTTADTLLDDFSIVANDSDFEDGGPPFPVPPGTVTADAASAQGYTVTNNNDGTIDYLPAGGYLGPDSFQYTITDTFGNTSLPATVNITVLAAANVPPVANDTALSTNEDTPLDIDVATVASDPDSAPDPITFNTFQTPTTLGGVVTVDVTDTTLTYSPPANDFGIDTFTFSVTDGADSSNTATITVTVDPVNDAPVCADVNLATDTDTALPIDVANDILAACTDDDGDAITLDSTTQPVIAGSTLSDNGAGTLTYTPAAGFSGDDSFNFTATDSNGGFDTAAANITVGVLLGNFTMLDSGGNVFGGTNDVVFEWDGVTFNSQAVDAKGIITDTDFSIIKIGSKSSYEFFGFPWTAHNIRVFEGPATLKFDTTCTRANYDAGVVDCNNPLDAGQTEQYITMTLAAGQVGAHILFDWSSSSDIDVVNAWNRNAVWETYGDAPPKNELWTGLAGTSPDPNGTWELISTDVNGDNINGSPMLDGPFQGFYANFSDGPSGAAPPKEPYTGTAPDTKLGSGLFASPMNPWILVTVIVTLFGARRFSKKR